MRKIVFLAILVAVTLNTGVKLSSAQPAALAPDLLGMLPDGNAVAVVDFQRITGSALWATISAQDKFKTAIDKMQSEMGDIGIKLTDVHTVALVFPGTAMHDPTIAITGAFEQGELLARLKANGKLKLTSEKYKNYDIYKAVSVSSGVQLKDSSGGRTQTVVNAAAGSKAESSTNEVSFAFRDPSTVAVGNREAVRDSIDVMTGAKPSITGNVKLIQALAQNSAAAIRFALAVTPSMTKGLQSSDLPIPDFSSVGFVFGSIDVASGIDLNITLRSDTAEHATSVGERLNSLLSMAKSFVLLVSDPRVGQIAEALKTVNIVTADVDVRITGSLPMDLLASLLSSATNSTK
jgi:hypothetical protein